MRDADNDITLLLVLQNLRHLPCFFYWIEILDAAVVLLNYQSRQFRTKTEDANLQTLAVDDCIWLDDIGKLCTRKIII